MSQSRNARRLPLCKLLALCCGPDLDREKGTDMESDISCILQPISFLRKSLQRFLNPGLWLYLVAVLCIGAQSTAHVQPQKSGGNHSNPRVLMTLKGHTGQVTSVALSQDSARIVTGSTDKTAKVWEAKTGRLLLT